MKGLLKWIEIDLAAIAHNVRYVRRLLRPTTRLMAVVKADGYGHGAREVGKTALAAGAQQLGVLTLEEAQHLRRHAILAPILLMAPALEEMAEEIVALRLTPTLDRLEMARALCRKAKKPIEVHVDVDTGLGRWGVPPKEVPSYLSQLAGLKKIRLRGLSTHLDYVAGKNVTEAEEKLLGFRKLAQKASAQYGNPLIAHAANSSILLDFPHWQLDMVRIGNLLYGINPVSRQVPLKKPWHFYARIISMQKLKRGQSVGYGSEYVASEAMRVATLPVGYSDGLTLEPLDRLIRLGPKQSFFGELRGERLPFIGRCGISHILLDSRRVPSAKIGDAVSLPIRRTAANPRIPRIYRSHAGPL
ncbi:MAG: alanine racemase [Elusimicrobia bacterium]|nr:alanine racemase [Elusimicrobiota bacterium]